jgi:NADPH:quinone reductase-like Zn-dependent oxidoreductase
VITSEPTATTTEGPMTAVVQQRYGADPLEVLQLDEVPTPTIGDDEVLVAVKAAAVDRGTWHLMTGLPYLLRPMFGLRGPRQPVPGLDLAGTVAAVGRDVVGFSIGDAVFGIGRGSFAPLAAASASKLAHKPAALSFEQAAALPVSGLTALQALRDHASVGVGDRVLILGASGGVGSYAVQIAVALGASVTGVGGPSSLEVIRSLGATEAVDYTTDDLLGLERHDVVIDIAGNRRLRDLRPLLTKEGRLVIVGGEEGGRWLGGIERNLRAALVSPFVSQTLGAFISSENAEDIAALAALTVQGAVTPEIGGVFPLDQAPRAVRALADGDIRGKAVIAVP